MNKLNFAYAPDVQISHDARILLPRVESPLPHTIPRYGNAKKTKELSGVTLPKSHHSPPNTVDENYLAHSVNMDINTCTFIAMRVTRERSSETSLTLRLVGERNVAEKKPHRSTLITSSTCSDPNINQEEYSDSPTHFIFAVSSETVNCGNGDPLPMGLKETIAKNEPSRVHVTFISVNELRLLLSIHPPTNQTHSKKK